VKLSARRVLFWAPRVLCVLFALFASMFAFDVFSESRGFWPTVGGLLIHLVPTCILVIVLLVAWRWEWVGAVLFTALAVGPMSCGAGRAFPWSPTSPSPAPWS
jgi:hypothetical protein